MKPQLKIFALVLFLTQLILACKKEEQKDTYSIQYKLSGPYIRDTSIHTDGYRILDLRESGDYCWTRVINGLDSNFCYGKYEQTSDTSLLWDGSVLVTFKITPIDSIPKRISLQLTSGQASSPLYGNHK